jgi:hypothetical protein
MSSYSALFTIALVLVIAVGGKGQTPSPVPLSPQEEIEAQEKLIQAETARLRARQEYLNQLKNAAGTSGITRETSGGSTSFSRSSEPNLETVSLSYEAIQEIAAMVDRELKPTLSQYRGIVVYDEGDFLALTRYRLYRQQVRVALANYESLVTRIEEEVKRNSSSGLNDSLKIRSIRTLGGGEALLTALNAPSIATSAIKSAAELASLFRTDRTVVQSLDVVDRDSMGTVIAGTFLRGNPNLAVFHPGQFVPEYDIGADDVNSLFSQVSKVNAAEAYLNYFVEETAKLPQDEQEQPSVAKLIASAKVIQAQIRSLGFTGFDEGPNSNDKSDAATQPRGSGFDRSGMSEFRRMMRAEKLDKFLTSGTSTGSGPQGKVGVLKARLLSSGGARRESKNLILGNKMDYSGSAVLEVALYDSDGTMRASEVFSYHTGFRKLKTGTKPRL